MPDDRQPTPDNGRSTAIPEPVEPALTFRGQKPTPGLVMKLWRSGQRFNQAGRAEILKARAFRRREESSLVQLAPSWVRQHPDLSTWVRDIRHERVSLDREQVARVGAVEPEYSCEALGFTETADIYKEQRESYMEEWRVSDFGPPTQGYGEKLVEDGQFARVRIPAHLDMDGAPDFFEMLSKRAYDALDDEKKKEYQPADPSIERRRKRYVKVDKDGKKVISARFDKGDDDKSKEAHDKAVQRYLLDKSASNGRIISALDCAPIWARGKGKERWELVALVERSLYEVEDLIDQEYAWVGMGDRLFRPVAYNADGTVLKIDRGEAGVGGLVYLYTAYLLCKDDEGCLKPMVYYTVGGAATSFAAGGDAPDDPEALGVLDICDALADPKTGRCKALEGRALWSYHFGLRTGDDDADFAAQPYLSAFIPLIISIEGNKTSINAAVALTSFTGHVAKPDAALAAVEGMTEAYLEQDGELVPGKVPKPGETVESPYDYIPFQQAQIGRDAWQQYASDVQELKLATSVDQAADASGHALVVGETIAKVSKRQIRDSILAAVIRDGEDHARIIHAIWECYGVKWPLQTVNERPVGKLGSVRPARELVAYDPEWVGDGEFRLKAEYPAEANLAEQDLAKADYEAGVGTFERVCKTRGIKDSDSEFVKILKDRMRNSPEYMQAMSMSIAVKRGDKTMVQILKSLQQEQRMTANGVPGLPNGIPSAALKRQGQQQAQGGGGPSLASSQRGGIEAGQVGVASLNADAAAQLAVGGQVA